VEEIAGFPKCRGTPRYCACAICSFKIFAQTAITPRFKAFSVFRAGKLGSVRVEDESAVSALVQDALMIVGYSRLRRGASNRYLPSRFWNAAEAGVVAQQKIAGMKRLHLEVGAVTGDEEPVADLVSQQLDGTDGGEFTAKLWIFGVGAV
jgi:hypothetical protein